MAQLEKYGLSLAECEKQVYAVSEGKKYGGVAAVIFLLNARGNRIAALLLKVSGPLGNFAYKLIASNRKSPLIRALTSLMKKLT